MPLAAAFPTLTMPSSARPSPSKPSPPQAHVTTRRVITGRQLPGTATRDLGAQTLVEKPGSRGSQRISHYTAARRWKPCLPSLLADPLTLMGSAQHSGQQECSLFTQKHYGGRCWM